MIEDIHDQWIEMREMYIKIIYMEYYNNSVEIVLNRCHMAPSDYCPWCVCTDNDGPTHTNLVVIIENHKLRERLKWFVNGPWVALASYYKYKGLLKPFDRKAMRTAQGKCVFSVVAMVLSHSYTGHIWSRFKCKCVTLNKDGYIYEKIVNVCVYMKRHMKWLLVLNEQIQAYTETTDLCIYCDTIYHQVDCTTHLY